MHGVGTCLELTIKRVACTVSKERRRNLGCTELLYIGRCNTQPAIKGVDHADSTDIGRYLVKCIGAIVGSECRTVYQFIEIESFIATKNTSGREPDGGYVVRI